MLINSPKELAIFISNQRKNLKLSQETIADLVGLKQKTISAFENKPETVQLETLFKILSAMNLDIRVSPKNKINQNKNEWKEEW